MQKKARAIEKNIEKILKKNSKKRMKGMNKVEEIKKELEANAKKLFMNFGKRKLKNIIGRIKKMAQIIIARNGYYEHGLGPYSHTF